MLFEESLLSLSEATNELARVRGKKPHVSTLWRWAKKGIRGVKLEVICVGGQIITSKEALDRFCKNLAKAPKKNQSGQRRQKETHGRETSIKRSQSRFKSYGIQYKHSQTPD